MPVTHLPRARSYATKPTNPTVSSSDQRDGSSRKDGQFANGAEQSQFYKTFTRPVAKVLLVAVFTYQVAYWSWVKLETDEVRSERDGSYTLGLGACLVGEEC